MWGDSCMTKANLTWNFVTFSLMGSTKRQAGKTEPSCSPQLGTTTVFKKGLKGACRFLLISVKFSNTPLLHKCVYMHISILVMTEFLEYPGYVKVFGYSLLLDTVAKMVKKLRPTAGR